MMFLNPLNLKSTMAVIPNSIPDIYLLSIFLPGSSISILALR